MVTGDKELKAPTILAAMAKAGVPTAVVTAKDKLRGGAREGLADRAHGHRRFGAACRRRAGADAWDRRSAAASLGAAGARSIFRRSIAVRARCRRAICWKQGRARLLYLSLSDYVQHGHAPEEPEAREFHRAVDARLRRLMELGGARRRHRRSRHARHGEARWHAERHLRWRCAGCGGSVPAAAG